ncbi:MAG TPA: oligosaccharide flippase family protein [Solirubrobacteraceae bacterium]|nr:oligosaccharide flippase family protein [Solirubrobacteraceae bacterium]
MSQISDPAAAPGLPPDPVSERFDLDGRTLREHAARGTLINGAFLSGVTALGFLKGFVLAALLTPEQFGVWGILVVAVGSITLLKQAGINDKYIQQDDPDQELAFQKAFTLECLFNAALAMLMLAVVPLIALAYGQPRLLAPGLLLIALLPAMTLQAPLWILYRRMRFGRLRVLQAVDPVLGLVVTVVLALAGAGYWALVVGAVAGAWAGAVVAVASCPVRLRLRYDRGTARQYVSFSGPLLLASLGTLVTVQSAVFFGELAVGLAGVGAIALASSISQLTDRIDQIITQTLYPAICSVADRTELLFESFVKSNRLALMWAMPFGLGLALFAPDLVRFVLGQRWEPAVGLIQAFGAIAAVGHLGFNWTAYVRARGDTRPLAVNAVVSTVAFLALGIPLLFALGLAGYALAILLLGATTLAVRAVYLARMFRGWRLARHALRALAPSVPAVVVVLGLRALEGAGPRGVLAAVAELALYLAVTAAATLAFERPLLREALGYLRGGALRPVVS